MPFFENNSITHDITTDAAFKALVVKIHEAIAACCTQTADTGQINLEGEVKTPTENEKDAGYEVWKFKDAAQATEPVYFKIVYGRAADPKRLRLRVTVGNGSNGTGTLLNGQTEKANTHSTVNPAAVGWIYATFHDGCFMLFVSREPASATLTNHYVFMIERSAPLAGLPGILSGFQIPTATTEDSNLIKNPAHFNGASWSNSPRCYEARSSLIVDEMIAPGQKFVLRDAITPVRSCLLLPNAAVEGGELREVEVSGNKYTYRVLPAGRLTTFAAPSLGETGLTTVNNENRLATIHMEALE